MKKFFIFVSLLTFLGGCHGRRQMQEEWEDRDNPAVEEAPTQENVMNGKEMGGGAGNR
jgi:hypothetical protein